MVGTISRKIFSTVLVFSQINQGGIPNSWQTKNLSELETIILPSLQRDNTIMQIDKNQVMPFEFAKLIDVDINNEQSGVWEQLPNGDKLWRVHLKSEGAFSINILFSEFIIPIGAKVFVFSPNREMILGAYTSDNNKPNGKLAITPIKGDELIVEYYQPQYAEFDGILNIGNIGHDYVNIFDLKDDNFGRSGSCNIDINCPEGDDWQVEKHAVCRMIIDGRYLCTGSLVNNANNDKTPFVLSANHCVDNQNFAENTVFLFNYESPSCNGSDGDDTQTISGSDLIATKNEDNGFLDFTLLKLSIPVPASYKPFFAGWSSKVDFPESTVGIHHPWADVKKIAIDNHAPEIANYDEFGYDKQTFWKVLEWDAGTTEKGSSGSPIFDQNHRIVGTLSGGEASCGNSVNDLYQMFSASYDKYSEDTFQLKKWLDPNDTGVEVLEGYNPYNVSVKGKEYKNGVIAFPNPANETLSIKIPKEYNAISFAIYNNIGQLMLVNEQVELQITDIDILNWKAGFYILQIKTTNGIKASKFIISH